MVTPVTTDKSINPGAERTSQRTQGMANEQMSHRRSDSASAEKSGSVAAADIGNARELYQMETNRMSSASSGVETPDEARSLLNRILEQISTTPEAAFKIQSGGSNSLLGNLLSASPN